MMKKYTSKISLATLPGLKKTGIMVAIFAFFSWSTAQAETLEIWSFTDELKPVAADLKNATRALRLNTQPLPWKTI